MSDDLTKLLFLLAPAVLVAVSVYFVLQKMIDAENIRRNAEIMAASRKTTLPLRLQAYERLTLFLERITPELLVVHVQKTQTSNQNLQLALLTSVREEYEHNLSQQIYVSNEAWASLRLAKESVLTHINESASKVSPDGQSLELAKLIIETYASDNSKTDLISEAKNILKKEVKSIF